MCLHKFIKVDSITTLTLITNLAGINPHHNHSHFDQYINIYSQMRIFTQY